MQSLMCWDIGYTVPKKCTKGTKMDRSEFRLIQDSDEYNVASEAIESAGHNLFQEYVADTSEMFRILDEIQANVTKLRELFDEPKSDKPDDLEASPFLHSSVTFHNTHGNLVTVNPNNSHKSDDLVEGVDYNIVNPSPELLEKGDKRNLRAVRSDGTFVQEGDKVLSFRNEEWTFGGVSGPRKVWVTDKADPNGPNSYPNMSTREFYPSVFNLGIWDIQFKEWANEPSWPFGDVQDELSK